MKTGIVGPRSTVDRIINQLETKKLFVEYVPVVYERLSEVVPMVRAHVGNVDNFFFCGPIPYHYVRRKMNLPCPVEYSVVDAYAITNVLFQAAVNDHIDVRKVTSDFYENDNLLKALKNLGYSEEEVSVLEASYDIFEEGYPMKNAQFHIENLEEGRANLCLTGTLQTYQYLKDEGYPVYLIHASADEPEDKINRLRLRSVMAIQDENQATVISIELDYKDKDNGDSITELQNYQIRGNAMERVYYYAQRLDASVERSDSGKIIYRIYTNKSVLSDETEGFRRLLLMEELQSLFGIEKVGIGVGLGRTSAEARRNSDFGRERAINNDVSCFFIVYEDQKIAGPIIQTEAPKKTEEINGELYMISRETQVGLDKLIVIDSIIDQYGVDVITPGELARLSNLPLNRINRLITKLESAGYAKIVGKKPLSGSGRPSRLLQINLKKRS
jgi:hypothetical protein